VFAGDKENKKRVDARHAGVRRESMFPYREGVRKRIVEDKRRDGWVSVGDE
jgi:hypothetical protein